MDNSCANNSPLKLDSVSPGSKKRRSQNKDSDNKSKKVKEESQGTSKKGNNVKRSTITGNEYQRILEILVRHRSQKTPGVKIGCEVTDIDDVDDIVYLKGRSCKCFQIKHLKEPITQLFKTNFPVKTKRSQSSNKKIPREFHVALYFESFVALKENEEYKGCKVEDLYLVTNNSIAEKYYDKYKHLLTQDNSFERDQLLYLEGTTAQKYNLNVELVKTELNDLLIKLYQKATVNPIQEERCNTLIDEFLTSIRIVTNYPNIETVRKMTIKEIFGELDSETAKMLEHCIIHMEYELLRQPEDFLTNEEWWETCVVRIESFIEKIKMVAITDSEKNRLRLKFGDLNFEIDHTNNMFQDLQQFLEASDRRVLHLFQSENVELTGVTVVNFLEQKNVKSGNYIYCTLESLVSIKGLLESYLKRSFELLVVACNDESMDFDKVANEIQDSFSKSEKKYIFISRNENIFNTCSNIFKELMHSKIILKYGFKNLDDKSKDTILQKIISFQGTPIELGLIFQNNKEFAERVIDYSCIWEIVNPKSPCTVSNRDAFISLGYDENYYIPRSFQQKIIVSSGQYIASHFNENTMVNLSYVEKCMILVGDSGEGKSTVLTGFANLIKKQYENVWVIRVNLRIFFSKNKVSTFGDVTKPDCATYMIFKMAFPYKPNRLEEMLFKEGLRANKLKVVLLLDGFNEVGSQTQNKVCALVKTIQSFDSILHCWITTQKQNEEKLVKYLNVRAYALIPFGDEDQRDLLVKYWIAEYSRKSPLEIYDVSELENDASLALHKWKQCICDENEKAFTSVSLNLKMLADILLDRNRKLDQHLSLLEFYNLFVKQKFLCYSRETSVNCDTCRKYEALDSSKENVFIHSVRKVLQCIAAEISTAQLPNDKRNKFPGMHEYEMLRECIGGGNEEYFKILLSKIGLINLKNDRFELSHESYVQFFFSEYVVNYLSHNSVQCFLMDHVLVKDSYRLCRIFIEKLLSKEFQITTGNFHIKYINQIKVNASSQISFKKDAQITVVIKDNLINIMQFVSKKLSQSNQKLYLKRVIKCTVKYLRLKLTTFAKSKNMREKLELIEINLNALSIQEMIIFLNEVNSFSKTIKSSDEARKRVETIFKIINKLVSNKAKQYRP